MKLRDLPRRYIEFLENSRATTVSLIATFVFIISVRDFFEVFSDRIPIDFKRFIHYDVCWASLAVSMILLFRLATGETILRIARVVLPSFVVILLAPAVDLLVGIYKHYDMAFMLPGHHEDLLVRYLTFFGPLDEMGVTPGMRLEIALVLVGTFIYFRFKTRKTLWSALFTLLNYTLIYLYIITPFIIKLLVKPIGLRYNYSDDMLTNFYAVLIFLTGMILLWQVNPRVFREVVKDIRPFRVAFFLSMFFVGAVFGSRYFELRLTLANILDPVLASIGILFACLFSIVTNNMEDVEIDRVSNIKRPLAAEAVDPATYRRIGLLALIEAFFYSMRVSFAVFFLLVAFIGNYFIYSMPPLRLKRILLLSKLIIGLNAFLLFAMGFVWVTHDIRELPGLVALYFVFGFGAAINFIDLKDYDGDKAAGICTLPVLLGLGRAKAVIGALFAAVYVATYFVLKALMPVPAQMLWVLAAFGAVQCALICRRNYQEKPIFIVLLASIVWVGAMMLVTGS